MLYAPVSQWCRKKNECICERKPTTDILLPTSPHTKKKLLKIARIFELGASSNKGRDGSVFLPLETQNKVVVSLDANLLWYLVAPDF